MKKEDIIHYLHKAGFTEKLSVPGKVKYVRITCPFAPWTHKNKRDQHESFGVEVNKDGSSFYHCFSCKKAGEFWLLFRTMGIHMKDEVDALNEISKEVYKEDVMDMASGRLARAVQKYDYDLEDHIEEEEELPDLAHMEYLYKSFDPEHEYLTHYLNDRGLRPEQIKNFGLVWDENRERVVIPVYSATDDFVGMVGRAIDPDDQIQKVYNYPGTRTDFGFGRLPGDPLESYHRIIIVEGMFDLMKTYQNLCDLGLQNEYGVVCVFKSILSEYQTSWLEELGKSIYFFFDNDTAGQDGWFKAQKALKGRVPRLTRITTDSEDEDAGDIDSGELSSLLRIMPQRQTIKGKKK